MDCFGCELWADQYRKMRDKRDAWRGGCIMWCALWFLTLLSTWMFK